MKQNERLLVYVVTGFLALILVIAVVFGSEPVEAGGGVMRGGDAATGAGKADDTVGLGDLLKPSRGAAGEQTTGDVPGVIAQSQPAEQPLNARKQNPAELVAEVLGTSRREHGPDGDYRWVHAQAGDGWTELALRWCCSVDAAAEAQRLNETTTMLRVGDEVAVPWVDDEVLAAAIEARRAAQAPRVLTGAPSSAGSALSDLAGIVPGIGRPAVTGDVPVAAEPVPDGVPRPGIERPAFRMPANGATPVDAAVGAASAGAVEYVVKDGDALWKIAARRFGAGAAERMVEVIKQMNSLTSNSIRAGQKLRLPASAGE